MKRIILIILMMFLFLIPSIGQDRIETYNSTVEFVVNTDTFIQNDDYQTFIYSTIPFIKAHSNEVENILLIGSASPEGTKQGNTRLANIRAAKIYSYISKWIPKGKIIINNDYNTFLNKTKLDESDYQKLRATYIEIQLKNSHPTSLLDTVYIEKRFTDTTYIETTRIDTVYNEKVNGKMIFGVSNSLTEDLLIKPNIGVEFYFHQLSFFIEGSYSSGTLFGKTYDIDFWHIGGRKYFNDNYDKLFIEIYGRAGWIDTNLFAKDDNGIFGMFFGGGIGLGWKFSVCRHWKIYPQIRFGFDNFRFSDYYYTGNGGVDVSFGKYVNGRTNEQDIQNQSTNNGGMIYQNEHVINNDFKNNSYGVYWFGPTYIGLTIQRNFYIHIH